MHSKFLTNSRLFMIEKTLQKVGMKVTHLNMIKAICNKPMATHSSIPAWKISWTEESAGYSPLGHKEEDTTEQLCAESLKHFRVTISPYLFKRNII